MGELCRFPILIAPGRSGQTALPAWSPDGKQVAYKSSNTIVVASITGGEERRITVPAPSPRMPANVEAFSWAPDGESFLVSMSGPQNSGALITANVRTGEFATLLEPPARQWISHARWLPDGKSMVFMQAGDVVLRNGDTGAQRTIYPQILGDEDRGAISVGRSPGLAVAPDGRRIAFSRRRRQTGYTGATFVQTIVDIADGQARDVTPFSNNVEASTWSHDGRYLLYVEKEGRDSLRTLWRVPATGGARERLGEFPVPTPGYVQSLSMRSDGRQLAFGMVRAQYEPSFVIENFLPASELKTTSTPRR